MEDERHLLEDTAHSTEPTSKKSTERRRTRRHAVSIVVGAVLLAVVLFACAFTGGVFTGLKYKGAGTCPSPSPSPSPTVAPPSPFQTGYDWGANVTIGGKSIPVVDWLSENLQATNIEDNLRTLTAKPHVAGTPEDFTNIAEFIYNRFKGYNFDKLEMKNYTVLLSYPNRSDPNVLQLQKSSGAVLFAANTTVEPPLTPGEDDPTVIPPFNAYSGAGTVSGPLVYVNYGTVDDFIFLTSNLSLNLTGSVCISRYGNIFRGNKALLGQQYGCIGMVIYSDPADYAPPGTAVYPDGPSLPPGGVQRGSLMVPPGDPLTHGVPALPGVFRTDYQSVLDKHWAPSIPVQPISYGDAIHFLEQLDSTLAPNSWQGGLNITYNILQSKSNTNLVYLKVTNYQEEKKIYDVIATIIGSVEPDRMVVLSNHHDAWTFGAVDPNSGTAALMEIARGFSELRKLNWRPGRTIVLCSWDAEEQGIIGSAEWVEDQAKLLGADAVACLNVDVGTQGTLSFGCTATPLLNEPLFQATKIVKCPNPGFDTVYDEWLHYQPHNYNGTTKPLIGDLGAGSDHVLFIQDLGITSSQCSYGNLTAYPVYHSVHDNFYWMSNFGDPTFTHHLAVGLVWSKVTVLLSTSPILPYDPRDYAIAVSRIYATLESEYGAVLKQQNISLEYLKEAVNDFSGSSVELWEQILLAQQRFNLSENENLVRILNGKLMNLERAFIHDEGLPGRSYYKHVVFAPSSVNSYGGASFPGISDTVFNAIHYGGSWDDVRRQIDIVRVHIRYATQVMNEPDLSLMYELL